MKVTCGPLPKIEGTRHRNALVYRTNVSIVMSSDTAADCTEDGVTRRTDGGVSSGQQLDDINDRLVTLSEKITMCKKVMNDLKDLSDVVARKSLQDVSLPLQK